MLLFASPLRCFGMLLSPGQKVSNSNMHLLDMVSYSVPSFFTWKNFSPPINKCNLTYLVNNWLLHSLSPIISCLMLYLTCWLHKKLSYVSMCFNMSISLMSLRSRWGRRRMGRPMWSQEHGTPTWLPFSHWMKTRLKVSSMKEYKQFFKMFYLNSYFCVNIIFMFQCTVCKRRATHLRCWFLTCKWRNTKGILPYITAQKVL